MTGNALNESELQRPAGFFQDPAGFFVQEETSMSAEHAQPYSVLMSVYGKEKAEYLRAAMGSIAMQSVAADEFVLVCDGPLSTELEQVLKEMRGTFGEKLRIVRLKQNQGLGKALNHGIRLCRNELVARMDSDDLSLPDRMERQLRVFQEKKEIDLCSGTVEEFEDSPEQISARRILPEQPEEIRKLSGKRNPFNHPCVMYKKSAVEAAGGYQDFYLLEDYYLWIRMLQKGFQGYNLPEPLLKMRAGKDLYRRRAGWKYARSQAALFCYMRKSGWIGTWSCVKSITLRGAASLIPNGLRKWLFETLFRK